MSIDYKNNLHVVASVIQPPTKVYRLPPVKDAYITQEYPYDEFGDFGLLQLKSSTVESQLTSKIIMVFQVPALKNEIYDNITNVDLVVRSPNTLNRNVNVQVKHHTDTDWIEDGTSWLGQPRDLEPVIYETTLKSTDREFRWNIKDIFMSHKNEPFEFAITILEDPNDGDQREVLFYSKEAGKYLCPAIEFTYKYFPDNIDLQDLKSTLTVRRTIPNADEPTPDLPGVITVNKGISDSWLPGIIGPTTYGDQHEIPGTLVVRRKGKHFSPPGTLTVRQFVDANHPYNTIPDLKGIINTKMFKADSGDRVPADPDWLFRVPAADLPGIIRPTTYDDQYELNGTLIVNGRKDLEGQLIVNKYNAAPKPIDPSDPEKPLPEGEHYVKPSELNGILTVRVNMKPNPELKPGDPGYIQMPELEGQLIVKKYFAEPTPTNPIPEGHIYKDPHEIPGILNVSHQVPNSNEPAPDLEGILNVRTYVADDDVGSTTTDIIHTPSSMLDGKLIVSSRRELEGRLNVKTYKDQKDLNGQLIVKYDKENDLDGILNVRGYAHLNGTIIVRPRKTSDLPGVLEVETEETSMAKNAYAFIM